MEEDLNGTISIRVVLQDVTGKRKGGCQTLTIPDVRTIESAGNLKALLLEIPQLCHISNCSHLETVPEDQLEKKALNGKKKKSKQKRKVTKYQGAEILDELVELGKSEALKRGDVVLVVPDPYTVQTAWEHVEHLRTILRSPPAPLVNVGDSKKNKTNKKSENNNEPQQPNREGRQQQQTLDASLDAEEQRRLEEKMLASVPLHNVPVPIKLSAFYHGTSQESDGVWMQAPSSLFTFSKPVMCVKSILPSTWNPPPPPRKLMGDLLYLQVQTLEDRVLQITCTREGFFVNRCTDQEFDPLPGSNPCFAKTLAELLAHACPKFAQAYEDLLQHAARRMELLAKESGLTDFDLASFGSSAADEFHHSLTGYLRLNSPMWNAAVQNHQPDIDRACKDAYDRFGFANQAGNPRDWNEDYQSCVEMPCGTVEDRVIRSRILERFHADFVENAKAGAMAIVEGSVSPLNPADPEDSHVFVYNSAFFSMTRLGHAGDSSGAKVFSPSSRPVEDAGLSSSPVATYSSSNQDLQGVMTVNSSLEVLRVTNESTEEEQEENGASDQGKRQQYLHTLNTVLVDYMGKRIIAQTIVPGILQNEQTASLLYGSVNLGKTIANDTAVGELVQQVMKPTHMGPSRVVQPAAGGDQQDEQEEKEMVLHAPVSCKALKGSEGRIYMLDLMRLTPVDLNFYGEGLCDANLDEVDYVACLRPELISNFVRSQQIKWQSERKQIAQQVVQEFRERLAKQGRQPAQQPKEEQDADEPEWDEATRKEIEDAVKEAIDKVEEPKPLTLDPNLFTVYQPKDRRSSEAVESTKELANFLISAQIPRLVNDLRRHFVLVSDGASLVEAMHSYGINVRYLGEIATQSLEAEYTAVKVASAEGEDNQVREIVIPLPPVPQCVPEICEIEMIARSCKWLLRRVAHVSKKDASSLPMAFIVSNLLNAVFGTLPGVDVDKLGGKIDNLTYEELCSNAIAWLSSGTVTKTTTSTNRATLLSPSEGVLFVRAVLRNHIRRHFGYDLRWWFISMQDKNPAHTEETKHSSANKVRGFGEEHPKSEDGDVGEDDNDGEEEEEEEEEDPEERCSPLPLLRRICQLSGIVVAARDYMLPEAGNKRVGFPFEASDVVNLIPVVKSCRPEWCLPEVRELLETSKIHLQLQNKTELQKAYQMANEALTLVCQVAGPAHRNAASCCSTIANVMQSANDMSHALELQRRSLALLTYLGEHDSVIVAQNYNSLALMYQADGAYDKAIRYLRRAIYLYELIGGPRNGEAPALYQRMATAFASTGNFKLAYDSIQEAISRTGHNEMLKARYFRTAAHILASAGNSWAAFQCEKSAYSILKQILGPEDPRTKECLASVEKYTRLSVEQARKSSQ